MSLPATLSLAMAERMASQARAVQRAAATHRKIMELRPRFGWPATIAEGSSPAMPFIPPLLHNLPASQVMSDCDGLDRAARAFEPHPALDPANAIRGDRE